MIAAAVLLLVVVAYRIVLGMNGGADWTWLQNFSPLAALVLCGAIYFPRRIAILFPFAALLISDFVLNAHYGASMVSLAMLPKYAALGLIGAFGWMLRDRPRVPLIVGAAIAGSALFFVLTNTGAWVVDPYYPKTLAGWGQALTYGRADWNPPTWVFFRNTLLSDVFFTLLFCACMSVRRQSAPEPAPLHREPAPWC